MDTAEFLGTAENFVYGLCSAYFIYETATYFRHRREQRFSVLDQTASPAKTYGNYLMNTHNAKLGVQFNFMELWSTRKAQWLNIWVGTGIGGTLARGTEYGMWVGNTITQGTTTTPVTSDISISG